MAGREGSLGGRLGRGGSAGSALLGGRSEGIDRLVLTALAAAAASSRSLRVGGNFGRLAGSYAGGSLCPGVPSEPWLVIDEGGRPADSVDNVECCDSSEEPEPRLTINPGGCVDVRRGGKVGADCIDDVRLGSGGGPPGRRCWASSCGDSAIVCSTAGVETILLGLGGINGLLLTGASAVVEMTGTVWLLASTAGRPGGGGGGGRLRKGSGLGAPVKLCCFLRAAILSARLLNWGSSVSAMMLAGKKGPQMCDSVQEVPCMVCENRKVEVRLERGDKQQ